MTKELVDPLRFVRSEWSGLDLESLGRGLVVEAKLAVYNGSRAFDIGLCLGNYRQSCRVPHVEAVAEHERVAVAENGVNEN